MGLHRTIHPSRGPRGRVLVVSLQRLGDLLTATHVASELAARPEVERVELLHFSPTQQAAQLLPGIAARHALDYNALKQLRHLHVFAAPTRLRNALGEIRDRRGFDAIVNLTSTPFACAIVPSLLARGGQVFGPFLSLSGEYVAPDPYSAYLNEIGTSVDANVFAHQDLYAAAATVMPGTTHLPPGDEAAQREATIALGPLARNAIPPLAVHVHTSDLRKDWSNAMSFSGWRGLLNALTRRHDSGVVLLGHPREAPVLQALADTCPGRAVVATTSLPATAELLRRCAGVVSVDTVTIHLAALVGCRSVVLRLGPAGGSAFAPGVGALVVDPRRDCHPCRSAQCNVEPALACHRDLHVGDIVELVNAHLFERPLSAFASRRIASRVHVRVCDQGRDGLRRFVTPSWFPAPASDRRADAREDLWRKCFWQSFHDPASIEPRALVQLLGADSPTEHARLDYVLRSNTTLGRQLLAMRDTQKVGA